MTIQIEKEGKDINNNPTAVILTLECLWDLGVGKSKYELCIKEKCVKNDDEHTTSILLNERDLDVLKIMVDDARKGDD